MSGFTTQDAALPLVVVFGALTLLIARSREVPMWRLLVIGLFGYYVALSGVAGWVDTSVAWVLARF